MTHDLPANAGASNSSSWGNKMAMTAQRDSNRLDSCGGMSERTIIALHCSGGNAKQWRELDRKMGESDRFLTPEHYGTTDDRCWPANKKFTLADEAALSLELIDRTNHPVHLVGHSYGGALALHIAMARPDRIASLSLYEPCAFHVLAQLGSVAAEALSEIASIAEQIRTHTSSAHNEKAMRVFVEYWNGASAWDRLKPEHQAYLKKWAPNGNAAFDALFGEVTNLSSYRTLKFPVLLMQGERSPAPTHAVTEALKHWITQCRVEQLDEVGHMGPLTHAELIAEMIDEHIKSATRDQSISALDCSERFVSDRIAA